MSASKRSRRGFMAQLSDQTRIAQGGKEGSRRVRSGIRRTIRNANAARAAATPRSRLGRFLRRRKR